MSSIKVFYVLKIVDGKEILLNIVPSKKDASEYVHNYLRLEYYDHFKAWCRLHDKDILQFSSWSDYCKTCVTIDVLSSFLVKKIKLSDLEVTESLRMLCGFPPLGLTYEGPLETALLIDNMVNMSDEQLKRFKDQSTLNQNMSLILDEAYRKMENGEEQGKTI